MALSVRSTIARLPLSATLSAHQAAAAQRAAGRPVLHMGFGQAPFPVHPLLAEALASHAGCNGYDPVAGVEALRAAALHYFSEKLGLERDAYDVLVAPGSKLILYALQMAIAGDLLLPVPSWVSYAPQAQMLGDRVIPVATSLADDVFRIDPDRLAATIAEARGAGAHPTKLIVNSPNNPTGLCLAGDDLAVLAEVCEREGVMLISDEIYALTAFEGSHRSIAAMAPSAAVTTGLSKHLSLGGWRIGFGFVPRRIEGLFDALQAIASETWSSVAAPVQRAALLAVSGDAAIEAYVERCTSVHAGVARHVAARLVDAGVRCCRPSGGFYLWPDFEPMREALRARGVDTSERLAAALLESCNVLALPALAFGAPATALALRLSVCDYDGATALALCDAGADPATGIGDFAPDVVAAADAIARFAGECER